MSDAISLANAQQRRASDPGVSAFVAASAGSGKTKLLTDRLLRLMLGGAAPGRILCLTYTKAAAAEMRIRLNNGLGQWVVMGDDQLSHELKKLDVAPSPPVLARARMLFAEVLDLPGGMRIETIHAFCQSLLRRFPLEAQLSPHFELADDERAAERLRTAREGVVASADAYEAVRAMAAETDEQNFAQLSARFCTEAAALLGAYESDELSALVRAALGAGDETEAAIMAEAVAPALEAPIRAALMAMAERGNKSGRSWAEPRLDWLALPHEDRAARWAEWAGAFFTGKTEVRKFTGFCGKALAAEEEGYKALLAREAERITGLEDRLKTQRLARLNEHVLALLAPIVGAERTGRALAAQLTYDELISHTEKLLIDPGAAWVLYKLDGGLDHLLLDEVQDTAPAQWQIANALAGEFFAGSGARDVKRSIFAVGDAKQSIFSFQGADLRSFAENRGHFKRLAEQAGERWVDGALSVSFRSSAAVLALTDAVFAEGFARAGVVEPGESLRHEVSRQGQAGKVTLWPLVSAAEAPAPPAWDTPDAYEPAQSAIVRLAEKIAGYVEARLGQELPARGRLARAGDFLILVRRRNALVGAMTSALKSRGIDVAGLDRMVLTNQQAVSDVLALMEAILLPEDDLALAQYLASPLGGLSDERLMALCLGRDGRPLYATLRQRAEEAEDWQAAWDFYAALRGKADFCTPFALLSLALGELGGRAKLLARLGPEAGEPLDEFLAEALSFAQSEPGALQSFVQKMKLSGASIKREQEEAGDSVRIMTVHGAKGLQAPIVVLPDTTALPDARETLFWLESPGGVSVPVFCPRVAVRPAAVARAQMADRERQQAELNRLLYVALTRAEDELLLCGVQGGKAVPGSCWYRAIEAGVARLGGVLDEESGETVFETPQAAQPDRVALVAERASAALPMWAGRAPDWRAQFPAREAAGIERIVPSRAVEDVVRRAMAASPLGTERAEARRAKARAMSRGTIIHALLEHLPGVAPAWREAAAVRYLAAQAELAGEAEEIAAKVLALLGDPGLAPLFGPGSRAEVPLAGVIEGVEIAGVIDRLAVFAGEVWVADYKSDRMPPDSPEGIPEKYAVQLAAYRAILRALYPGHAIRCVIIWLETAQTMDVPGARLDLALAS